MAAADATGILKALSGIQVYVYDPGTTTLATIYTGRIGAAQATNPVLTDATGLVEFYAEIGEYDIRTVDSQAPPRIADRTTSWNAFNGGDQALPTAKIQRDAGLDMTVFAADVLRQVAPIGQVIDWWRPASSVPIPSGWEICDGRTITADNHEFGTGSSIQLPDLRNKFIMGADVLKSDGAPSTTGDGTAASNVQHPNAPGIRGVGGFNASKNLAHNHQFAHTHGVPGVDHLHSAVSPDHLHAVGSLFTGNHAHSFSVNSSGAINGLGSAATGSFERTSHGHQHGVSGGTSTAGNIGVGGTTGARDRNWSFNTSAADRSLATTTNTQSTSTTDNGSIGTAIDMRPAHVGLLKLMKVRRN